MIYISRAALNGDIEKDDAPRLMRALLTSDLPDGAIARMCDRSDARFGQHAILCIPNEPWLVFTSKTGGRMIALFALKHGCVGTDDILIILQEIDGLPLPSQDDAYDRVLGRSLSVLEGFPRAKVDHELSFELSASASESVGVRRAPDGSRYH